MEPGDFTTRLTRLSTIIARELRDAIKAGKQVSIEQVTNLVFKNGISNIRDLIVLHANSSFPVRFLFDNIDKGWPASGVQKQDITIVRLLIESLVKVRRDLASRGLEFQSTVFIRHDIYDLMLDQTPDRGKSGQVSIDWTDKAKLAQVIYKRLQVGLSDRKSTMQEMWARIMPKDVFGQDSLEYFINHCLMRPRFLIDLIEAAIANAINRGHSIIAEADCIDAIKQYSLSLVDDFGFEMRDVSGISSDVLYSLIGVGRSEPKSKIIELLGKDGFTSEKSEEIIDLMLWYGLVGASGNDVSPERFIYDFQYNMKRLRAAVQQSGVDPIYAINPALQVGLSS